MPETTNLKLYKKDPIAEKKTTFNIETMLNENWDKIDQAFGGIENALENIITYKDILNLSATPSGAISWSLPQSTDNTRTAIVLCRATKDISNMDYATCLADASITKNTLAQNATSNTYTGLTNSTQYWVKAFVKYALGGKEFYSNGVTVTFTTAFPLVITEFYNAGNEFTAITGGWVEGISNAKPPSSFTKGSEYMTIHAQSSSSENGNMRISTNNKIDFSTIKTLKFEYTFDRYIETPTHQFRAGLVFEKNSTEAPIPWFFKYDNQLEKAIVSLDVSSINVAKYIQFHVHVSGLGTQKYGTAKIYRVWGES